MDINIVDIQSDDISNKFTITIYGKTIDDKNVVCHIIDYLPVFYIKIPINWTINKTITNILNELEYIPFKGNNPKKLYKDQGYYSCDITILEELQNDLYVSNEKFKFLELKFKNYRSFIKYRYSIKELFKKDIDRCAETSNSKIVNTNSTHVNNFWPITGPATTRS